MRELIGNKNLIEEGDWDSSSGSDDAPSEDNLDIDEICLLIPPVDKKLKSALKKVQMKKASQAEKLIEEMNKTKP